MGFAALDLSTGEFRATEFGGENAMRRVQEELEQLRPLLERGRTTIEEFIALTCPGNPGNLHDEAWEVADRLVERMRGGEKS